jgi:hypothetical protein
MVYDDVKAPHAAERRIGERAMPAAIRDAMDALKSSTEEKINALVAAQRAQALVSNEVIEGARAQLRHRIERLERRLRAAATAGETAAVGDLNAVRAALVPHGDRQERRLNYVPFFARHGESLIAQLKAGAAMHAGSLIGNK